MVKESRRSGLVEEVLHSGEIDEDELVRITRDRHLGEGSAD